MARRKNPIVTLVLFVLVVGFAYAAYEFLYVERIQDRLGSGGGPAIQYDSEAPRLQELIETEMASEENFSAVSAINWSEAKRRYRLDILLVEGTAKSEALRLVEKIRGLVAGATKGTLSEVTILILGREVWHFVP